MARRSALHENAIRQLMAVGYGRDAAAQLVDNAGGGSAHGETVVPDASGAGIKPKGRQGNLYAAVEASPVLKYDEGAIAAMWQGLIEALRTGGAIDAAALFPDPCDESLPPPRRYAQERAMGQEMARMIGLALKALGVTTDEWAAWYAKSALVRIRHAADCGCGCRTGNGAPQLPGAGQTVAGWGSPFGPPAFSGGGQSGGGGAGSGF